MNHQFDRGPIRTKKTRARNKRIKLTRPEGFLDMIPGEPPNSPKRATQTSPVINRAMPYLGGV